jgi:hypothetical protein
MLATHLADLLANDLPGVPETLDVIDGVDDLLGSGLARVDQGQAAALAGLASACAATPLADLVAEATEKITSGSISDDHLLVLAAARIGLLGAVHDAVLARFDAALARTRRAWDPTAPGTGDDGLDNLRSGARSWLRELAIVGWRGVDHDVIAASSQILHAVLAEPPLRRLAVLLDGLASEFAACSPVSTMDTVPARRWADLWTRGMLLSQRGGSASGAPTLVSGRLLVLGVEVHEHGTATRFLVHGLLETPDGSQASLVRTNVVVSKVDAIVGPAVWKLPKDCPVLLAALAGGRALEVTDLPLLPSGDLVWRDEHARQGEQVDPFATARVLLPGAVAPPVPPLERHPTRIAEPVLLEGYTATVADPSGTLTFDLAGQVLDVDVEHLPSCGPLTPDLVAGSSACLGVMRWTGSEWRLAPLAVQSKAKRKTTTVATADWTRGPTNAKAAKSAKASQDAVAVLRERAGRLLRK